MRKKAVGGTVHRPPTFESIGAETRLRICSLEESLSNLSDGELSRAKLACHSLRLPSHLEPVAACLHHPLSDHFIAKHQQENRPIEAVTRLAVLEEARVLAEEGALHIATQKLLLAINSNNADSLVTALANIASCGNDKKTDVRNGDVSLGADRTGQYWTFPRAAAVKPLLHRLHADLKTSHSASALFAAIVGLVTINCIHPFMDGNGRTSRIVFNAMLVNGGKLDPKGYIPCKHIYAISKYGFEIRLRLVILKNDWLPMIDYFIDLVELFCAIGKAKDFAGSGK
jgi:Fic/DOC family